MWARGRVTGLFYRESQRVEEEQAASSVHGFYREGRRRRWSRARVGRPARIYLRSYTRGEIWWRLHPWLDRFIAQIENDDKLNALVATLRDSAVSKAISADIYESQHYTREFFYGFMVDNGCAKAIRGWFQQYKASCRHFGKQECIETTKNVHWNFGISATTSQGLDRIDFPVKNIVFKCFIHIIDADVSLLLSLEDMENMRVYYENMQDKLFYVDSGELAPVFRKFGHPFVQWSASQQCFSPSRSFVVCKSVSEIRAQTSGSTTSRDQTKAWKS